MKSSQASRYYQGYARKKREALEAPDDLAALKPSVHQMPSACQAKTDKPPRPSATVSNFNVTEKGSTFARNGFSKRDDITDNRDYMAAPTSSFGNPAAVPKRVRPATAKASTKKSRPSSAHPKSTVKRTDKTRSRSARRKHEEMFPKEINADLTLIETLEKKRDETKKELKSLLKQYLTDNQRAVFTAPPVRKAMEQTEELHGKLDKLTFLMGAYGNECKLKFCNPNHSVNAVKPSVVELEMYKELDRFNAAIFEKELLAN